jgi:hypothetical protein
MPDEPSKILYWIINALLGVVMALGMFWMNSLSAKMNRLEEQYLLIQQPLFSSVKEIENLDKWLNRVESKIDRTIEDIRQQGR